MTVCVISPFHNVVASDSAITKSEMMSFLGPKFLQTKDGSKIISFAGELPFIQAAQIWANTDSFDETIKVMRRTKAHKYTGEILVYHKKSQVFWALDETLQLLEFRAPFAAIGVGGSVCNALMTAGLNPVDAIFYTTKTVVSCQTPIFYATLDNVTAEHTKLADTSVLEREYQLRMSINCSSAPVVSFGIESCRLRRGSV